MPTAATPDSDAERVGVPLDPALADLHHLGFKLALLAVWAAVSFGIGYFAADLQFSVGPWPFSYWVAAQGGMLVFIALAWGYCWAMQRFERRQRMEEGARPEGKAHG